MGERHVAGLDGRRGAGAHRHAQVGGDERGRVVDPVAHHRDHATRLAEPGDRRRLVGRHHLCDHLVDPDLGGHGPSRGGVVPREQHRVQAEPSQPSYGVRAGVLDAVADVEDGRRPPSISTSTAVRPPRGR